MALSKTNFQEAAGQAGVNIYATGKKNPFTGKFRMLTMQEGQTYKLRLLPMNWEERYGETNKFYHLVIHHGSIGLNAQELTVCPARNELGVKVHTRCPLCDEFAKSPAKQAPDRAKLKAYYYVNAILLSDNMDGNKKAVPRKKENGKFIVYTLRLSKTQVFDMIANYYSNQERAVKDMVDLETGCAISIMVGKKGGFKNYQTQILEASRANVTSYIDVDDIVDLRNITAFVPSYMAVKFMMDNTSVVDAIEMGGKIDFFTGKQTGGSPEDVARMQAQNAVANTPAANMPDEPMSEMQTMDESDMPDGLADFAGDPMLPGSGATDLDDLSKL